MTRFRPRPEFWVVVALVVTTLATYAPVIGFEFVGFDDPLYVSQNAQVHEGLSAEGLRWAWALDNLQRTYWHPLTWMSHMLDWELFGLDAGLHHVSNVLFHVANAVLLFLLLRSTTGSLWSSAAVAAVFALHPINVESVAWIAQRKNLLSTLLSMLTLLAWVGYARRPGSGRYALAVGLFTLCLLAKPVPVSLPLVMLLLDVWPLARLRLTFLGDRVGENGERHGVSLVRAVVEKVPMLALSVASSLLAWTSLSSAENQISVRAVPLALRAANAVVSVPHYVAKILAPRDLAVFYPFPRLVPAWQVVAAVGVLVLVTVVAVSCSRRRPFLGVGWLWFLITLVPMSGLVQVGLWPAMADRWAYIPAIGLFLAAVWTIHDLAQRHRIRRTVLASAVVMLLIALISATRVQLGHWCTTITLFEHATGITRDNYVAHFNLGSALSDDGRQAEAISQHSEALRIQPDFARAHNGLGVALARAGHLGPAMEHFTAALSLEPGFDDARANLEQARDMMERPNHDQ